MIKQYLRARRGCLLLLISCLTLFWFMQMLYRMEMDAILYITLLTLTLTALLGFGDYVRFRSLMEHLNSLDNAWISELRDLPETSDPLILACYRLILRQREILMEQKQIQDQNHREREQLVTLWMHQIKLPLASLQLITDDLNTEEPISAAHLNELKQELFRVEQYAQTALKAIQIENLKEDLILSECDLGELCAQAVKKQALMFILKKIPLNFTPFHIKIVTDPKWLSFILEQILSNALKYTPAGSVTVRLEDSHGPELIIADTGIGIAAEDLPRIFESGYTGYNGHQDFKASGIGLTLCKKTADTLGIELSIHSKKQQGTEVRLRFPLTSRFLVG